MLCRVCIIAGDISPIDVIIHIPVMCEDRDIPYIYVPSKEVRQFFNLVAPAKLSSTSFKHHRYHS